MKTALVTGADGFIGSHLVSQLVEAGYEVRALCQYNSFGYRGWLDDLPTHHKSEIEVVFGDIRDPDQTIEIVRKYDTIFHLAALIAIPYSYVAPQSYIDTNVMGTTNVLRAARMNDAARIVHTSTSEVYGSAQQVPISEKHRLYAQSPYAASKIAADQIALSWYCSFDMPVVTVRPFNTYGPRQSIRAILPTIITQIAAGKRQIELGSLTPTRDFNFVTDTCNGFLKAAEADFNQVGGAVFNLGSNFEVSIGKAAEIISEIMDVKIDIVSDEQRLRPQKSEVERLFADATLAHDKLNWRPEFGGEEGFKAGVARTVEWFTQSENLAKFSSDRYGV